MPNKQQPTLDSLAAQVEALRTMLMSMQALKELKERAWLHRKELMARYRISEATLHRWIRRNLLPEPLRFSGPLWRLADLERAEAEGRIPRPVSA